MIILLDSGPVGLLTYPRLYESPARACNEWAEAVARSGNRLVLPRIIDYEIRRELNRLGKVNSLARLDALEAFTDIREVDAQVLRTTARFWAAARRMGVPTADPQHLDIDMILSGHAADMAERHPMDEVVIATGNLRHLRMFADARDWASIT